MMYFYGVFVWCMLSLYLERAPASHNMKDASSACSQHSCFCTVCFTTKNMEEAKANRDDYLVACVF